MRIALWTVLFWPCLLAGCSKDGGTPAYVRLTSPKVVTANGVDSISSKITDLWVYANDAPLGVWQPGRDIPVLAEGNTNIKVIAGIRKNGITDDRIQYLFYGTFEQQVSITAKQVSTLQPKFKYFENVFTWLDDFENGTNLLPSGDNTLVIVHSADSVFQGNGSARFTLDSGHPHILLVNDGTPPNFPITSSAFLELDYRSDVRFLVGVQYYANGSTQQEPIVYVSPTQHSGGNMPWNHIYIDLGTSWSAAGGANNRFYIEGQLQSGETSGRVYLDNVKVVYR